MAKLEQVPGHFAKEAGSDWLAIAATSSASVKEHEVGRGMAHSSATSSPPARVYTSPRTRMRRPRRPAIRPMRAGRASLCKPAIAQPQHKSQKPAFLVPFEVFYDALTYARTLKGWPHEPPQKSAALTQAPQRQQEHVAAMVERWLGPSLPMIQIFCRSTPSVSHNHTLSPCLGQPQLVEASSASHR
ncbi:uncharacterized protein BXZ73DRAFT_77911 [Epithele typhae]|uniref:uncharacterized protein n=1 Tax=Epithele typhae TaxID=378194 RepID=UPI0020083398|nr:uncharacterized protein BXZ73DRAFT_77911 [Epithele typhae]KAH9930466.1 hypothetical protein BXZ73DRAFT_77911 [Epithele typhae]